MSAQDNIDSQNVKPEKEQNIYRVVKDRDYLVANTTSLRDASLSWKAKGIHLYMLSMKDDWNFNQRELATHATDGKDSLTAGLKELKESGYVKIISHKENGQIKYWETIVYEVPQLKNKTETQQAQISNIEQTELNVSRSGFPRSGFPRSGKSGHNKYQDQTNIDLTTTTKNEPENKPDKVVVDFDNGLISELQSYGIYPDTAKLFVKEHQESYLRSKIAFVNDYKKQGKKIEDMGSLLYQAIVKNWTAVKNESSISSSAENIHQYVARKNLEKVKLEMENEVKRDALVEKLGIQHISRELQDEKIEAYQDQIAKNAFASMKGALREPSLCGSIADMVGATS